MASFSQTLVGHATPVCQQSFTTRRPARQWSPLSQSASRVVARPGRCVLAASSELNSGESSSFKKDLRSLLITNQQPVLAPRTQDMMGDPFGLLMRQRIVFLGGEVNDFLADSLVSQMLLLDSQDPTQDIKLFINSPGGSVTAGMGIYDAMQMCRADVQTYCFGLAASMGAFLLGAGTRGKRYSMPNSRIMIHQPLGGASGAAVDLEIQAKEIMYHKANLNRILADCTGQPVNKIEEDTDRDRYMSPLEAKQYGLIDHIIGGDDAGFKIQGDLKKFPKTKEEYVNWGKEENNDDEWGSRSARFVRTDDPYMKPLADK